jgi:hypothetical protein
MSTEDESTWVRCNSCKKPIPYGSEYWVCNVSTCNRVRTALRFCSVTCWDAHLPGMNHREAWAEDRQAPTREEWAKILSGEDEPKRVRKPKEEAPPPAPKAPTGPAKVLVRRRTEG